MSYEHILRSALQDNAGPYVAPAVKFIHWREGISFPVLYCDQRANRPFRKYPAWTRSDCPLCAAVTAQRTCPVVVNGMHWLAASWPIKSLHGICYPQEHRAAILPEDICSLGAFVDEAQDAVACINMRGSAASVPEHFHAQLHDCLLPASGVVSGANNANSNAGTARTAFPLLACPPELIAARGRLALYQLPTYPAFALILKGDWDMLGRWLTLYMAASNLRSNNFVIAPGGQLVIIPRGLEKAPNQENRFGASEMLGLVAPVTYAAYCAIQNADEIIEALRLTGLVEPQERLAVVEHVVWAMEHLSK